MTNRHVGLFALILGAVPFLSGVTCTRELHCQPGGIYYLDLEYFGSGQYPPGVNYEVLGDQILLTWKFRLGNQLNGPSTMPVIVDGVTIQQPVAGGGNETMYTWFGPIVDSSTSDKHTLSITNQCGTIAREITITKTAPVPPYVKLTASPNPVTAGHATTLELGNWGLAGIYSYCYPSSTHLTGRRVADGATIYDQDEGSFITKERRGFSGSQV